MKKWLILEGTLCTIIPIALIVYFLPTLEFATVEVFSPASIDGRNVFQRVLGMLPYIGGVFGLWVVWRFIFLTSAGKKFAVGWQFVFGFMGSLLATIEVISTTNTLSSLLICVPTWFLVGHLLYVRRNLVEERSTL